MEYFKEYMESVFHIYHTNNRVLSCINKHDVIVQMEEDLLMIHRIP